MSNLFEALRLVSHAASFHQLSSNPIGNIAARKECDTSVYRKFKESFEAALDQEFRRTVAVDHRMGVGRI